LQTFDEFGKRWEQGIEGTRDKGPSKTGEFVVDLLAGRQSAQLI
jgi:hypothetical protein